MSPAGNSRRRRSRVITDPPGVRRASVDYGRNRRPRKQPSSSGMRMTGPKKSPIQWAAGLRGMTWQPRKGWFHLVAVLLSWVCVLAIFTGAVVIQVGGTATAVATAGAVAGVSGAVSAYSIRRAHGPDVRSSDPRVQRIRQQPRRQPTPDTIHVRSHRNAGHGVSGHERRAPRRGGAPRKGGVNRGATTGKRRGGRPA